MLAEHETALIPTTPRTICSSCRSPAFELGDEPLCGLCQSADAAAAVTIARDVTVECQSKKFGAGDGEISSGELCQELADESRSDWDGLVSVWWEILPVACFLALVYLVALASS